MFLMPITWPNTHSNHPPTVFSGILGEYKTFIHSYSFFLYIFHSFVIIVGHHYGGTKLQSRLPFETGTTGRPPLLLL